MHSGTFACLGILLLLCQSLCDNIIVRTNYGPVSGKQKYILGKKVYEFRGIPYAQPPIGDLRFKYPKKPKPWKNILDASSYAKSCVQSPLDTRRTSATSRVWVPETEFSEDCLYLNIWSRENNHSSVDESNESTVMLESSALFGPKTGRPVMVWIHGGSLTRGSTALEMYNGAYLASKMDVVVVTVQYRLGPLGFLYLGTEDAPGNQGLMDQVAALQWVRENIAYFGGNPQQVTLFGHAGGVVCVALHLLSPVSSSLYQQAILQSGSPLAWWAIESKRTASEKAEMLAMLSGCESENPAVDVAKCLRSIDAETLELNQWHMQNLRNGDNSTRMLQLSHWYRSNRLRSAGYYYDIPFKPVVTEPLLPRWPYEVLGSGKLHMQHRIMLGVNKDEGMFHLIQALRRYFMMHHELSELPKAFENRLGNTDPVDLLAFYIMDENFLHPTLLQATIFEYQIPSRAIGQLIWGAKEILQALNEVGGDYNIKCPVVEFADFYSRAPNSQVFLYSFEHQTKEAPWPEWTGVMQGYEAEYVFGAPFNPDYQKRFYNFTDDERGLSEEMMRFWTNFASTGSPNLNPGEFHTRNRHLYWERYTSHSPTNGATFKEEMALKSSPNLVADTSRKHMVFRLPESQMERNLQRHHCMFWREQLPLMREQLLSTGPCSKDKKRPTSTGVDQNAGGRSPSGTFYPQPTKRTKDGPGNKGTIVHMAINYYTILPMAQVLVWQTCHPLTWL
uniref:Cholinesterase n=1 Tax=Cryptocotyle lingua TaxID=66766 RepID=A0A7U0TIA7_9TREM|nr:cholinesterase [Cryptocotyle lingua]